MLAIGRALMPDPGRFCSTSPAWALRPTVMPGDIQTHREASRRAGLTVLLVEQNAKNALAVADRGYVLETGRILLQGTSEELLANRDVQRAYLGRERDGS
jgi:branched-chain amino acid transport system ATP-binding protein